MKRRKAKDRNYKNRYKNDVDIHCKLRLNFVQKLFYILFLHSADPTNIRRSLLFYKNNR